MPKQKPNAFNFVNKVFESVSLSLIWYASILAQVYTKYLVSAHALFVNELFINIIKCDL